MVLSEAHPTVQKGIVGAVMLGLIACGVAMMVAPPAEYILGTPSAVANIDPGDTAWVLVSSAMVMLMTPGIAFFYGGMISGKNTLSTITLAIAPLALIPVIWSFIGFSLAFGDSLGDVGILGNPATYGLMYRVGASPNPILGPHIPWSCYFVFQLMFAIITPAIIIGSVADRINFHALCLFVPLWHMVVYCPVAHMIWHPTGMLKKFGILDFAGGTVVHMSSGFASLVTAWFVGPSIRKRHKISNEPVAAANKPLVVMGTALLWFAWMGFNGGSTLQAGPTAAWAVLTSNLSAASAMLGWMLMDSIFGIEGGVVGLCMGAVVGMVSITPAAGYVNSGAAILIGISASIFCHLSKQMMDRYGKRVADDALDVFSVHGVGGVVGMICTSLFSSEAAGGTDGALFGDVMALGKACAVVGGLAVWFSLSTWLILFLTSLMMHIRVDDMKEVEGLDDSAPPIMSISKLSKLHIQARSLEQQHQLQHQRQKQQQHKQQQYTGLPSAAVSPLAATPTPPLPPTSPFASPPRGGTSSGFGAGRGRESVTFSNLSLAPATLNPLAHSSTSRVQTLEKAYAPEKA